MGLRFYRRLRIAPGFTLNLSKRGASVSAGVRGAHFTAGSSGTRETVGLPGTGISYTAQQGRRRSRTRGGGGWILLALILLGFAIQAAEAAWRAIADFAHTEAGEVLGVLGGVFLLAVMYKLLRDWFGRLAAIAIVLAIPTGLIIALS